MRTTAIACTLMIGLLAAGVDRAPAETVFTATLNGTNNVPPIPEVSGTGMGRFVLNDAQTELTFHVEYNGLSSAETASHIHVGGPRENGGPVFGLPLGTPKDGVWAIPPEHVANLLAGRLYVNVHSTTYITGEIRGNLMPEQVPVQEQTWGRIKALY